MHTHWRTPALLIGGGVLVGLAVIAGLAFLQPSTHVFAGVVQPEAARIADFTLETSQARSVPLSSLQGRYVLVAYGYTFCPDVCPATLAMLSRVVDSLGPDRDRVLVVFISIDPERDTPERIAQYVTGFDEAFIGLSGTPEQIAAAAQPFNVSYTRRETPGSAAGYLMNHSAFTYLLDPAGRWRVTYPYGIDADAIVQDLRYLFGQAPNP
ncbi:MAG: SCO family protein [Anaerolineales bacterium]|nr:SCO family protein [Anaerolineales bacterium]